MNQLNKGVKAIGLAAVLLSLAGCGNKSQTQLTESEKAAADQATADKRAKVEADPSIPPAAKAKILGGMPAESNYTKK